MTSVFQVQTTTYITINALNCEREMGVMPLRGHAAADVIMEDETQQTDMNIDEKVALYHTAGVFNSDEAIRTLNAALRVYRSILKELMFTTIVVDFFFQDKRGILYGFDHENHPIFVIYISSDGADSDIHVSNPFTPIVKAYADYANLRRFYTNDL
ncbi:hypothetical protein ONZ45_g14411 [Pleurotus djamor]|nr:hypothetical protein ONZ45_g14411 [Pleurotus djamor]